MEKITGKQYKELLINAANNLANHKNEIDSLNVFPVPDGDTGTNMTLTITSGVSAIQDLVIDDVGEIARTFSKGILMGARGNSGVILSQIFRGLANGLANKQSITPRDFVVALQDAKTTAYKAVMKPVEGTILTVMRETSEYVNKNINKYNTFEELFDAIVSEATKSLNRTPELLPVLKEVGVVDSGGAGLVKVFVGMQAYFKGETIKIDESTLTKTTEFLKDQRTGEEFGYCTEFLIELDKEIANYNTFDQAKLKNDLTKLGDSIVVVQDEDIVKVHVHTLTPGDVLNLAQKYGEFIKIKIENMTEQHNEFVEKVEEKETIIIAVAPSEGIGNMFISVGVDYIVFGGQTMNPASEDFAEIIKKTNCKNAIILPNNSNIIMAASQVKELLPEVNVEVIPTKNIPQGLTAAMIYSTGVDFEENIKEMTNIIKDVKAGQITYSIRDTEIDGIKIKKGDYMAMSDGNIVAADKNKIKATKKLLDELISEDNEIITLIIGEDVTEKEKEDILKYLEEKYEDLEVEVHIGNQPVYSFIIGVE